MIAELLSHMNQTTQTRNPTCVRNLVLARSLRTVPAHRAGNEARWQWLVLDGWLHQHGWVSFRFAHIWEAHDEKLQCLTANTFLSKCVLCHPTYITLQRSSTGRLQSGATWQLGTPAFSCHAAKKEDIFKRGKQTQED